MSESENRRTTKILNHLSFETKLDAEQNTNIR